MHKLNGGAGSTPEVLVTSTLALLSLAAIKSEAINNVMPTKAVLSLKGVSSMVKSLGIAVVDTVHAVGCSCLASGLAAGFI